MTNISEYGLNYRFELSGRMTYIGHNPLPSIALLIRKMTKKES